MVNTTDLLNWNKKDGISNVNFLILLLHSNNIIYVITYIFEDDMIYLRVIFKSKSHFTKTSLSTH